MSFKLPEEYVLTKFYQYAGTPKHNKATNTYMASCPSCMEGKSWNKKRRLYYVPADDYLYCHNCLRSWSTINWVIELTGKDFKQVMEEVNQGKFVRKSTPTVKVERQEMPTLPDDSINLFDKTQTDYYLKNKVVQDALLFIKKRRLDTAINKPRALFISLKDFVHKNRLCIPFYDADNQIRFYQTRAIYKHDEEERPKYLSKMNADKRIYGIKNINPELGTLFIFEGPIDASFTLNGIAVGGISLTELQEQQLSKYRLMDRVWILDNQLDNKDVVNKLTQLIEKGEKIFIWPEKFKSFKDLNEVCMKCNLDKVSNNFFTTNAFSGMDALLKIKPKA